MRPKSWIKNGLVFLPLFFSHNLFHVGPLARTALAFAGFCLLSSAVYSANDIFDAAYDRRRDDKMGRPVAAGRISACQAWVCCGACMLAGVSVMAGPGMLRPAALGLAYAAVNAAYTLGLKHEPIFDVACISAGFVLRVYAGSAACGEPVSEWLFLTVVSISLALGFGKRYGEMAFSEPCCWRKSVRKYDRSFLTGAVFLFSGLAAGFYALWAVQSKDFGVAYSTAVLLLLLSRYLLDLFRNVGGGDPVGIFYHDKALSAGILLYAVLMAALLYL